MIFFKHILIQQRNYKCLIVVAVIGRRSQRSAQSRRRKGQDDEDEQSGTSFLLLRGHTLLKPRTTDTLSPTMTLYLSLCLIPSSFLSHFMSSLAHLSCHPLKRPKAGPEDTTTVTTSRFLSSSCGSGERGHVPSGCSCPFVLFSHVWLALAS